MSRKGQTSTEEVLMLRVFHITPALVWLLIPAQAVPATPMAAPASDEARRYPRELEWGGPPGDGILVDSDLIAVSASSTLCAGKGAARRCHAAKKVLDDERASAWCEGAVGTGAAERLTFTFVKPVELTAIELVPFCAKDFSRARNNARPKGLVVETDAGRFEVVLADFVGMIEREPPRDPNEICGDLSCGTPDERVREDGKFFINLGERGFPAPMKTTRVSLTVERVYPGSRYADLCISSVGFYAR